MDNKIFVEIVLDSIPYEIKIINKWKYFKYKYAKLISNKSGIKHGTICKLFKIIKKSAKNKMQSIEFGEFLLIKLQKKMYLDIFKKMWYVIIIVINLNYQLQCNIKNYSYLCGSRCVCVIQRKWCVILIMRIFKNIVIVLIYSF